MSESNRTPDTLAQGEPKDLLKGHDRVVINDLGALKESVNRLIESDNSHSRDFRWTWTGIAASFLVLAGMLISGFLIMEGRLESTANRLEDRLDAKTEQLSTRLDAKIDPIGTAVTRVETKLGDLSDRLLPPPAPPRGR